MMQKTTTENDQEPEQEPSCTVYRCMKDEGWRMQKATTENDRELGKVCNIYITLYLIMFR